MFALLLVILEDISKKAQNTGLERLFLQIMKFDKITLVAQLDIFVIIRLNNRHENQHLFYFRRKTVLGLCLHQKTDSCWRKALWHNSRSIRG